MSFFGIKVITSVKSIGGVVFALGFCPLSVPRASERQIAVILNKGIVCIGFTLRTL